MGKKTVLVAVVALSAWFATFIVWQFMPATYEKSPSRVLTINHRANPSLSSDWLIVWGWDKFRGGPWERYEFLESRTTTLEFRLLPDCTLGKVEIFRGVREPFLWYSDNMEDAPFERVVYYEPDPSLFVCRKPFFPKIANE